MQATTMAHMCANAAASFAMRRFAFAQRLQKIFADRGYASLSQPFDNAIAAQSRCAIKTLDMASFGPIEPQGDIYEAHNF